MIWIVLAILIFVVPVALMYMVARGEKRRRGRSSKDEPMRMLPDEGPEPPPPGPWTISGGISENPPPG
jgi:hypothetical protein